MVRKLSIQTQLVLFVVLALVLLTAGLQVAQTVQEQRSLVQAERDRSLALAANVESVIQAVTPLIVTLDDATELNTRLASLVEANDNIAFMAVTWPDGTVIFHSDADYKEQTIGALADPNPDETVRKDVSGFEVVYLTSSQQANPVDEGPDEFNILVGASASAIDDQLVTSVATSLLIAIIGIASVSALIVLLLRSRVLAPFRNLMDGVQMFSEGRLDHRIEPRGTSELAILADSMNQMALQIQEAQSQLEGRVQARTRDLQIAAQVSEQVSTILDPGELLPLVVELTKSSFDLYHAHIYLIDDSGEHLVLSEGAGEAGRVMKDRGHSIPARTARSLVARAARDNKPVIVADTAEESGFLANPLLPKTRSEAALPLAVGNRVLGVLDVQSDQVGHFDADLLPVLSTLAGQIAVAIENARLFSTIEQASRYEQTLSTITQSLQRAASMDEVLQLAARELGRALRVPYTAIELQVPKPVDEPDAPVSPVVPTPDQDEDYAANLEAAPH